MKRKFDILLNEFKNASSKNVDIFLDIDLQQTFNEIRPDRYDNNFDLAAEFQKERDKSASFRLYGEVASTIIDCDNVTVKVFSDSSYQNLLSSITTSSIAYNARNVFGKKRGKYYLELNNYLYDEVFFLIETDNFYYVNQKWSQRLKFYDTQGLFVSYGTETVDIDTQGNVLTIENDFPFFFNKHWIRLDYNIIEEKKAKYTFSVPQVEITEAVAPGRYTSASLTIGLDKPSPFGNESLTLGWGDTSGFQPSFTDVLRPLDTDGVTIGPVNVDSNNESFTYNGKALVKVYIDIESVPLISPGRTFQMLSGDYAGVHEILQVVPNTLEPGLENGALSFFIILDVAFDQALSQLNSTEYRIGSTPDVLILINNNEVQLPHTLSWTQGEQMKNMRVVVPTDFEAELDEFFNVFASGLIRVERGIHPSLQITIHDSTPKNPVYYNLGPVYETRFSFTGRTTFNSSNEFAGTIESPAVLRNGLYFEGRNEEFYNNDHFNLTITNEGDRTLLPVNQALGLTTDSVFQPGESRTFQINTKYTYGLLHQVQLVYLHSSTVNLYNENESSPVVYINGFRIPPVTNPFPSGEYGYSHMKPRLDGTQDWYIANSVEKPFTATFDDTTRKIILTSKSPGVKLIVSSNNPDLTITELNQWQETPQIQPIIVLYANADSNQQARYGFKLSKDGFKELSLPVQSISAPGQVYLITSYSDILYPYYSDIETSYNALQSTDNNSGLYSGVQILQTQPSLMPKGNVFVNGLLLLAANTIIGTKGTITEYGVDVNGEIFYGGFYPQTLETIPCVSEEIVQTPSKGAWEITIAGLNSQNQFGDNWAVARGFDITYGEGVSATILTVRGNRFNATSWWNNGPTNVFLNGSVLPGVILRERLDTGNSSILPGPFQGTLIQPTILRLATKLTGTPMLVDNIENYSYTPENKKIKVVEISRALSIGDININSNRLGGFNIEFQ